MLTYRAIGLWKIMVRLNFENFKWPYLGPWGSEAKNFSDFKVPPERVPLGQKWAKSVTWWCKSLWSVVECPKSTMYSYTRCDIIELVVHLFPGRGAAFAYFFSYISIIEFVLQVGISSAQIIVFSRLFLKNVCVRISPYVRSVRPPGLLHI